MKFSIRDLLWLILLVAVICLAYRHERLFKRSIELEAIKNKEQLRQEMVQQHRADLDMQEMRHAQAMRDLVRSYYKTQLDSRSPIKQLEMPSVKPKDGA